MKFMPAPSLFLQDKAATLAAIEKADWMEWPHPGQWHVKSQWLCDELNEFERTQGFAYNLAFKLFVEAREKIGPYDENSSPLSILIYNAQGFRRSDAMRAQGFEPGHPGLLHDAYATGKKIELLHDSLLGGSSVNVLTVKLIAGKLYAMLPKKRKYAVDILNKPVRLEGTGPSTELPAELQTKAMVVIKQIP